MATTTEWKILKANPETQRAQLNSVLQDIWNRLSEADRTATAAANTGATLSTIVDDPDSGLRAAANAIRFTTSRVFTLEGATTAIAEDVTALEARVDDLDTDSSGHASAISALDARVTINEGDISSTASDVTTLESTVNDPVSGVAATASAVETLETSVAIHDGEITTLYAQHVLTLDVNGRITGWKFLNDGSTGIFDIVADRVKITSPAGVDSIELADGILSSLSPTHAYYQGVNFGTLDDFIAWYGPIPSGGVDFATEEDGLFYIKNDGSSYFGGDLNNDVVAALPVVSDAVTNIVNLEAEVSTLDSQVAVITGEVDVLTAQVGDIMAADEWNVSVSYGVGEIVKYNEALYRALQASTGNQPDTSPAYWELIGNYTSLGEAVSATVGRVNIHDLDISNLDGDITAVASDLTALTTVVDGKASTTALNNLDTRVTTAEGSISTQGSAITSLDSRLDTAETDIATKASATALEALDTRVDATEASTTAHAASISKLEAKSSIHDPFVPYLSYGFNGTADGWVAGSGTVTQFSDSIRLVAPVGGDAFLQITGLNFNGELYNKIRARIRRVDTDALDGDVYYQTSGHGWSGNYRKSVSQADKDRAFLGGWQIIEWDMAALTAGGTDWLGNSILGIRLDLGVSQGDDWDIDWIEIGARGGASEVSVSAIQATTVRLAAAEGTISGHTADITALEIDVAGKAGIDVTNALDARLDSAEGTLVAHGSDISAIEIDVAGKASTAALDALDARVDVTEASTASHATSITNLNASVGGGNNLYPNADLANGLEGYGAITAQNGWNGVSINLAGATWVPPGMFNFGVNKGGLVAAADERDHYGPAFPIDPTQDYISSVYCATHRGRGTYYIQWLDAAYAGLGFSASAPVTTGLWGGGQALSSWNRPFIVHLASAIPSTARYARFLYRAQGNDESDPYVWWLHPMFEPKRTSQTSPSPWVNSASGAASATVVQAMDARVVSAEGAITIMEASYALTLDVNGYVTGFYFLNDGTTSAVKFNSANFTLTNPAGGNTLSWTGSDSTIVAHSASYGRDLKMGPGFGADAVPLAIYYGPDVANASATMANAIFAIDASGKPKFGNTGGNDVAGWSSGGTISSSYTLQTPSVITFNVAAGTFVTNGVSISYNAGSAQTTQARSSTVNYYLYYDDGGMAGGTKTLYISTDSDVRFTNPNYVLVGGPIAVTVPATGGGTGPGGPPACVSVDTPLPTHGRAGDVLVGDRLVVGDSTSGFNRMGLVSMSKPSLEPCVRFATENGWLQCSYTAPIAVEGGTLVNASDLTVGMRVPRQLDGVHGMDTILHIIDVGPQMVQSITCENDTFLAGNGCYYYHHNIKQYEP